MEIPWYLQGGCVTQKMIQMARIQMVADSFDKQKSIEFQTMKAVAKKVTPSPPEYHIKRYWYSKPRIGSDLTGNIVTTYETVRISIPQSKPILKHSMKVDKEVQCELPKIKID